MASGYLHFADYNTILASRTLFDVTIPVYVLNNPKPSITNPGDFISKPILIDFFNKSVKCIDFNNPDVKETQCPTLSEFYHFTNISGTNYFISDDMMIGANKFNILFGISAYGIGIAFVFNFPTT